MTTPDRPPLQRQRYWQGQTLRSRDFNDYLAHEDQKRWWHNRAVHEAFGIVSGLNVGASLVNGETRFVGQQQVLTVSPGLAYDCAGRELVLRRARETLVPARGNEPADWTLLARHPDRTLVGFIPIGGGSGVPDAELIWKPTKNVALTDGVPIARGRAESLARVPAQSKRPYFAGDLNFTQPPSRAAARPRVASGSTIEGKTPWSIFDVPLNPVAGREPAPNDRSLGQAGIEVTVDTSAAGFTQLPCYFVWLHSGPWQDAGAAQPFFFEKTVNETVRQFTFRLINLAPAFERGFPTSLTDFFDALSRNRDESHNRQLYAARLLEFARRNELFVCWLGVQMTGPDSQFKSSEVDHVLC